MSRKSDVGAQVGQFPFAGVIGQADVEVMRERSRASRLRCPPGEDKARQEFRDEVDVNSVVSRYGENFFAPVNSGRDVDYDLDLMGAIEAVEASRAAWGKLPEKVRAKYRSWEQLQVAAHSGELAEFLKPSETPAAGAGGSGGSASGSAAGGGSEPPKGS